MNNSDKVVKFYHPDMPLPPDISKSNQALDDYLSTLKRDSEAEQRRQYRYAKMSKTRQQNALKENKIEEVAIGQRSVTICNDSEEDSKIIIEKRIGYKLIHVVAGSGYGMDVYNDNRLRYCSIGSSTNVIFSAGGNTSSRRCSSESAYMQ